MDPRQPAIALRSSTSGAWVDLAPGKAIGPNFHKNSFRNLCKQEHFMPAPDVDDAFVRQYESEVHAYFQRQGSKLMNTVRMKSGVVGESTTFQTYGQAVATQKTRNGDVTQSNPAHAPVIVTLEDWYVQVPIDKFDELKINHDERGAAVAAGAAALGIQRLGLGLGFGVELDDGVQARAALVDGLDALQAVAQ
jgi:hypothetical protein